MDDQISRTILENFDVAGVEQNEIGKINAPGVLRGIENGSLHFITTTGREQEFIDHSLLNPEYITTHIPNGFIVDFIANEDGNVAAHHFISEHELEFQNDEQERKLTAALLQLVNKQCPVKIGNETQVIVTNKDMATLTPINDNSKQTSIEHNFLTIDDQQTISQSLLNDGEFKLYQQQTQINPPLPPLTPISRLSRPRKNDNLNSPQCSEKEFENGHSSFKDTSEDIYLTEIDTIQQRPLAKKSLPHKKRITKKLKNIEKPEQEQQQQQQQIRSSVIYQDIQVNNVEAESITSLAVPQFSCQLCGALSESQMEFFSHLKIHYEPSIISSTIEEMSIAKKENLTDEQITNVEIQFDQFNAENIIQQKIVDDTQLDIKDQIQNVQNDHDSINKIEIPVEVEFSDTEDMLEGIRGVVDKVQQSVDNDSNDEMDIITGKTWFNNSALNGNTHFKTEINSTHNQSLSSSVDNFTLFFKTEVDKIDGMEGDEEMRSQSEEVPTNLITETEDSSTVPSERIIEKENQHPEDSSSSQSILKNILNGKKKSPNKNRGKKSNLTTQKSIICDTEDDEFIDEFIDDDDDKGKKKKRVRCPKCNRLCNSANALKYHDLSHTGERPHQCEVCGKGFFALSALKVHMRLHSGDKPFECEICKRAFRQWGDLKYHTISIHTNEKNFQCEFCGKAFARKYSLVIHRRIHTSEKNYKCEFCPKAFRASSYLQNHRKVHTGEKPYACQICGKKFRVSGDLKRHVNIHGREKRKPKQVSGKNKSCPVPVIKIEDKSNDTNSCILKAATIPENSHNENSVTMFSSNESIDIFKAEPTSIDDPYTTPLNQVMIDSNSVTSIEEINNEQKKMNNTKEIVETTSETIKSNETTDQGLPMELGKFIQKGTNLVCFWS